MEIKPIEDFVLAGFQQRVQQQFGCPTVYVTASDKVRVVQQLLEGRTLKYPYATLLVQSMAANPESYTTNFISRKGLIALVDEDEQAAHRVRLLPAAFEVEVEYVTNKFKGPEGDNVWFFLRRWLFARRIGSLSFSVNYGRLKVGIQVAASEQIPFTPREDATENVTEYKVVTSATIRGYISEPILGTVGIVNTVALLEAEGLSGGQFFPFERG